MRVSSPLQTIKIFEVPNLAQPQLIHGEEIAKINQIVGNVLISSHTIGLSLCIPIT